MYLGYVLIRCSKVVDMETASWKEEAITYNSQEERAHHSIQGHRGKHRSWSGGGRTAWARAIIVFFMGRNGQGWVDTLSKVKTGE